MRGEAELIEHLQILGLSEDEARIYIYLVQQGSMEGRKLLSVLEIQDPMVFESLISKGVIIRSPSDSANFIPLHPRNAAANLYKGLQEIVLEELRRKRKIADRLGMVLEPVFELSH